MIGEPVRAAVVGGSGYVGGELVRLLLDHPEVEVAQVTSDRLAGQPVTVAHPNLRGRTGLRFRPHAEVQACDVLFLAMPHGTSMHRIEAWAALAPRLIDLSADFRLSRPEDYERHYGTAHPNPGWLGRFVPGIPELHRDRLGDACHVAVPGCMANAALLALAPVAAEGLVRGEALVDARTGSSGSGADGGPAGLHAERSGAMRVFRPAGHRHEAEIEAATGVPVRMSATGVEAVRGVQVLVRLTPSRPVTERDLWDLYRDRYAAEPFVRVVKQRNGAYRLPEPKILSGSNYCDVGFAVSQDGCHVVLVAALDNLMKGGAGNAVQCLNVMSGWGEGDGLGFAGLHPV